MPDLHFGAGFDNEVDVWLTEGEPENLCVSFGLGLKNTSVTHVGRHLKPMAGGGFRIEPTMSWLTDSPDLSVQEWRFHLTWGTKRATLVLRGTHDEADYFVFSFTVSQEGVFGFGANLPNPYTDEVFQRIRDGVVPVRLDDVSPPVDEVAPAGSSALERLAAGDDLFGPVPTTWDRLLEDEPG